MYLRGKPYFVRAILFNKTPENNWYVTWHQDRTVAVSKKLQALGWGRWSTKSNILHVQPPLDVLNSMATFRIHLDSSDAKSGCLSVIPGSHKHGILSQENIRALVNKSEKYQCIASPGSALVMCPHLVHLEYTCHKLPEGIIWC